jgi:hypothetical protein
LAFCVFFVGTLLHYRTFTAIHHAKAFMENPWHKATSSLRSALRESLGFFEPLGVRQPGELKKIINI